MFEIYIRLSRQGYFVVMTIMYDIMHRSLMLRINVTINVIQVKDLESFIEAVTPSSAPIVAGHSFGGMVIHLFT